MQTDSPKVMALWIAWQMTNQTSNFMDQNDYIAELRKNFSENYKAIAEAAQIDELRTAKVSVR